MDAPSNLTDQALAVLASHPGEALTGHQIAKLAGMRKDKAAATLHYLYTQGRVRRMQDRLGAPFRYRLPDDVVCTEALVLAIHSWPANGPITDGEEHL